MKRAFTLIELLVVIAIIAILAAILFPVFAQAKAAAKATASLSNTKQTTLAVLMYGGDADDCMPAYATWGDQTSPVWYGSAGTEIRIWSYDIFPYMKAADLLNDPLAPNNAVPAGWPKNLYTAYNPQINYNYTVMAPYTGDFGTRPWVFAGVGSTSVGEPANTVLLSGNSARSEHSGDWWYGAGTIITTFGGAEPPDCNNAPAWCFTSWGDGFFSRGNMLGGKKAAGAFTGFNTLRKGEESGVATFLDGHAAFQNAGRLAAGTNFRFPTSTSPFSTNDLVVNDVTKYMWDNK